MPWIGIDTSPHGNEIRLGKSKIEYEILLRSGNGESFLFVPDLCGMLLPFLMGLVLLVSLYTFGGGSMKNNQMIHNKQREQNTKYKRKENLVEEWWTCRFKNGIGSCVGSNEYFHLYCGIKSSKKIWDHLPFYNDCI
jgi:hypothetical protein